MLPEGRECWLPAVGSRLNQARAEDTPIRQPKVECLNCRHPDRVAAVTFPLRLILNPFCQTYVERSQQ